MLEHMVAIKFRVEETSEKAFVKDGRIGKKAIINHVDCVITFLKEIA